MYERVYNNQLSKHIVTKNPRRSKVNDHGAAAAATKVNARKLCDCPGSEPGKIIADTCAHLPGCRFRKRSSQYASKMSVIPPKIRDGCSLGVAIGMEDF